MINDNTIYKFNNKKINTLILGVFTRYYCIVFFKFCFFLKYLPTSPVYSYIYNVYTIKVTAIKVFLIFIYAF